MKIITYLIGAGASRQVLPIVNEIPDRILELIDLLSTTDYQLSDKETFAASTQL